jgi:hypothetical protein
MSGFQVVALFHKFITLVVSVFSCLLIYKVSTPLVTHIVTVVSELTDVCSLLTGLISNLIILALS